MILLKLYAFLLIALILLFSGCVEKKEQANLIEQNNKTDPVPTTTIDQDQVYKESFTKYSQLVNLDAANLVSDSVSSSRTSQMMSSDSQTIIQDTLRAYSEIKDLNVSSKYTDSYNEYLLALDSYNAAGKSMLNVTTGGNVDIYTNYMHRANAGTEHMEKAVSLFNVESGSSIQLKTVVKFT